MKWDFRLTKAEWLIAPIGSIISAVFTIIAMVNHPSYSPYVNYLSDLGVKGVSSWFFNSGVIIAGICGILFCIMLYRRFRNNNITFLGLSFVALVGVGVVNETHEPFHATISGIFFGLFGLSLLLLRNLWKVDKNLFYYSILTAAIAISFIVLNDIPFLEHLAAASMVVWSIMAGLKLAANKI